MYLRTCLAAHHGLRNLHVEFVMSVTRFSALETLAYQNLRDMLATIRIRDSVTLSGTVYDDRLGQTDKDFQVLRKQFRSRLKEQEEWLMKRIMAMKKGPSC